ncbi:MAG TPA: tetratricopeptide repeat protein [Vicinamibacteria bacterium]
MPAALLLLAAVAAAPPANLLLVTIDTLRADHLHAYGYAIDTPATDTLARTGMVVEDATVQVPETLPSHASLLTGRYPYEHRIRDNFSPPFDPSTPTLATLLRARGYDTAAFIGSVVLTGSSGLDHGFALYDDVFSAATSSGVQVEERRAEDVVSSALGWLKKTRPRPFFAWVHLYDPHAPYEPPEPYRKRYAGRPYDGEVAYADAQLGRLLDFLAGQDLQRRTLVVVTSDHGEGLGDHGEEEHMMFLYDSTLRVPLLLSWPGVLPAGARVKGQFRSVDLLPTVLDLLGIASPPVSGASRAASLRAGAPLPESESYAESLYGSIHFGYAPLRALRSEGWKYVDAPRSELYELKTDPGEGRNLRDERHPIAERMRERLRRRDTAPAPRAAALPADAGTIERMAALGYVGASSARPGGGPPPDPKDKIAEFQAFTRGTRRGVRLFDAGDYDGAIAVLAPLARGEIVSLEVQFVLGRSLVRKKRYAEAVKALETAVELLPKWSPTYFELSHAYAAMGDARKALAALDRGLQVDPGSASLHRARGLMLQQTGDPAGARAELERARDLDPADARLRLMLSAVYRDAGDLPRAVAEVRASVRLAPASADGWNALGLLLAANRKDAEAETAFRSALKARPDDPDALFNLAETLQRSKRAKEAADLLERLVARVPSFPGAAEALERARREAAAAPAGQVRLSLLRVATREEANDLARRLAAGEGFAALARARSNDPSAARGGELGLVRPEELAEPLRSAAAAMALGAHSAVLETPAGYVILYRAP